MGQLAPGADRRASRGSVRVAGVSWLAILFLAERVGQGGRNGQGLGAAAVTASWFGLVVPGSPRKSVHILSRCSAADPADTVAVSSPVPNLFAVGSKGS